MRRHLPVRAINYLKTHLQKKKWRRVVTALSCIVVFCTTYALILPAVTMSQQPFCGKEEHIHDPESCYERVLICGQETADGAAPEQTAHVHTDACYQEEQQLICGLTEGEGAHVHTPDCYDEAGTLICGLDENFGHQHTSDCYRTGWVLACGQEEGEEAPVLHEHTETCYEDRLVCEKEEHAHSLICYSDPTADLESPAVWERTIPQDLTDDLAANVAAVANSQLGYAQSSRNYTVDENGGLHGYTRYGAWFGDPYGEWCAMFASFCLHYAGIEQSVFPYASGCIYWTEQLTAAGLYAPVGTMAPRMGDLVFFDQDGDRLADHVGILTDAQPETLTTAEGNIGGCVVRKTYALDDASILGYGVLPVSAPDTPDEPDPGPQPICGLEAHTHVPDCYSEDGLLICPLPQHTHTADCYEQLAEQTPLCGLNEHTHTESCYDADGTLLCTLPEHTHTDSCYLPQEPAKQDFSYDDAQLHLRVTVESPQPLPEGTALAVQTVDADSTLLSASASSGAEQWIVRQIGLTQAETPVDTSEMTLTAEVLVKSVALSPLFEQADEASADVGVTVSVMQTDEDAGLQEVESVTVTPGESVPVLTVSVQDGTLALLASSANPEFTVQYYADIPRFATSGDAALTIFDTAGGNLPTNKKTNPTKSLYLDKTGNPTQKNAGNATEEYVVATAPELTRMYADNTFEYVSAPEPKYVDKLMDNEDYKIKAIWVLKDGRDRASTDAADWDVYPYPDSIRFTNRQAAAQDPNLIYIRPGKQTVLRLVYDAVQTDFTTPATFYDYDIASGQNPAGKWSTGITGINSQGNYGTSTNGQRKWDSYCDVLAFGNANCGTGMGNYKFDDVYLNCYSGQNYGCTFRLAKELQDGKIVYNDWIVAPKLFNDGDANGKHTYSGSSLTFQQVGDTYTLSSARVAGLGSIDRLDKFFNPSPKADTTHTHIYTNDFWPLDAAIEKKDPLFGSYSNPIYYQGFKSDDGVNRSNWVDESSTLPFSDDGQAHNSFFGMQYAVEFTLTPDYIGPLEYTFFGDDDMWVFLDNQLVCDIGGVHSSVGEYVELWDYLQKEGRTETEKHTLTVFYTERGASGSTCYMNFTLPSVSGINIKQTTGGLMVYKEVSGEADPAQEFTFYAVFTRSDGSPLTDDHTCYRYDANGVRSDMFNLCSGGSFRLKAGEHLEILNLPVGTSYDIVEDSAAGYTTTHTVNGVVSAGRDATGIIVKDTLNEVVFTNTRGTVPLRLQKLDQDSNPLSGAVFRLQNADGDTINVVKNGDGSYSAVTSAADVIEPGKLYYITAAGDQSYVVGQNTSNFDAQLQKKTGANTQRVCVYQQTDGSYSFQSVENNKWLDLDAGGLTDGTLIHFWENPSTPTKHDNQKWYLSVNKDGTFKIKPRVAVLHESNLVFDLSQASFTEGQKIQGWADNDSPAQKWLLVPVDPVQSPAATQDLEVSATGELTVTGLLPGCYTLTETTVPEGFRNSLGEISLKVNADGTVIVTKPNVFVEVDGQGALLKIKNQHKDVDLTLEKQLLHSTVTTKFSFTVTYTTPDGSTLQETVQLRGGDQQTLTLPYGSKVTITEENHDGFAVAFQTNGMTLDSDNGSCSFPLTENILITAVNSAGYALPSTGSGGTGWFMTAGLLLFCGAALASICLRKRRDAH